jgi:hypothetical protein
VQQDVCPEDVDRVLIILDIMLFYEVQRVECGVRSALGLASEGVQELGLALFCMLVALPNAVLVLASPE